MEAFWDKHGKATKKAPEWVRHRHSMTTAFPTYYETSLDKFSIEVGESIRRLNTLKPTRGDKDEFRAFLGDDGTGPDYSEVNKAEMSENPQPLDDVIEDSIELFNGMMNLAHPLCMPNVIPPANKAGIIASMLTDVFSPNIIEGEYAWNVEKAEMESAAMLARLIGWDPEDAGGVYTYGGSGCYFYGLKYALTSVLGPDSRCTGIRVDGKILVSQQGHYAKMNSTDWSGLGMNNIIDVETDDDTNAMDIHDLERKMKSLHSRGIPIFSIVCTMGTTDAFAVDPVAKVRKLVNRYPNPAPYNPTFIYCDAVIGWSFLTFKHYNFERNPLGFSEIVKERIRVNMELIKQVKHADAVGIDFHKTGWAPYNCSIFMMKDYNHFREVMTRPGSAYLQERTPYNPGLYTLEVSRSGSYAMAGWATLKYFGMKGFQTVIGGVLEVELYLRALLRREESMVCVNEEDHGFVTLFRVYPEGTDAENLYEKEVSDPAYKDFLKANNELQAKVADILWYWFRHGNEDGEYGPYTSYTTGFRTTDYNDDLSSEAVIYALKSFPMNLNVTAETMVRVVRMVKLACEKAMTGYVPPTEPHLSCPPYNKPIGSVDCGDQASRPAVIKSLLSGVAGKAKTRGKGSCNGACPKY